jgi:hypothetical protein
MRSTSEACGMNGALGDNPLSDLTIHGEHPFPPDIEKLMLRIEELGERQGRWPLGENWPFSPREWAGSGAKTSMGPAAIWRFCSPGWKRGEAMKCSSIR